MNECMKGMRGITGNSEINGDGTRFGELPYNGTATMESSTVLARCRQALLGHSTSRYVNESTDTCKQVRDTYVISGGLKLARS